LTYYNLILEAFISASQHGQIFFDAKIAIGMLPNVIQDFISGIALVIPDFNNKHPP